MTTKKLKVTRKLPLNKLSKPAKNIKGDDSAVIITLGSAI